MDSEPDLEALIQARGRALLASVEPERLIVLTPAWWQEQLLEWAAGDPEFRTRLLRFVDVLPALRTPGAVAEHVRQYFRHDAPLAVRAGSAVAGTKAFRPVLSRVVRQGVFSMADRFIGAASPQQALPRLEALNRAGVAYTIDLLGEATLSEEEADAYARRYQELFEVLGARRVEADRVTRPNVSVKLSALTSHFEAAAPAATSAAVRKRLGPLLERARAAGVFVNVDMEQYRARDAVQTVFRDALGAQPLRDWAGAGIVVQAYLRDSLEDIEALEAFARERGTPLTVRLVKGAYWDEEVVLAAQEGRPAPVFTDKDATDANYERCTARLLTAYPHLRPAFATHNPRTLAQAMVRIERSGVPASDVEFQMLYGMAEGLRKAVQAAGYLTRVYVPAGEIIPGMAYLVRRLLENSSNESWFLHRHETGNAAALLRRPEPGDDDGRAPGTGRAEFANHSPAEFYRPAVRRQMDRALADARSSWGTVYGPLVAGAYVETGDVSEVTNPAAPGTVIGRIQRAGQAEVEAAVRSAGRAANSWGGWTAEDRAIVLRRAAGLMAERRFDFAATMVYESGKPWREADGDVIEAIDYLRYYAGEAERLERLTGVNSPPGERNRYLYEPRGVVACIAPWNFPLAIITGMASAALAAGCAAILKPASPIVAAKLAAVLLEAGVPEEALHYLPGPGDTVGRALVEHPGVDVVAFTGSNAVGLQILRAAADVRPGQRNLKRTVLEMGGKNAVIVDEDADLDEAVAGVVASAFGYAGQKCSACSRVIVAGSAYEGFRERLRAAVASLVVGSPEEPFTQVPPVISAEARERINAYLALGKAEGQVLAEAAVPDTGGHYVTPTVFEGIGRESRLAREEIFGPVLLLFRARSFAEALELAMDSPFGLTGGVFSRHPAHIGQAKAQFRVGNLYINRKTTGAVVGRQPFGGLRMSGAGDKAGGPDYLLNFLAARTITENTLRRGFAEE
jgi:RHH-type transcriptional regulator, proline utilization regulon repressor / proline dehydrogenase / delta 1-pyrroline-5-carboxylate dehydrogenase